VVRGMRQQVLKREINEEKLNLDDIYHGYRVAELAIKVGKRLDLDMIKLKDIYVAGIFHDIGKSMIDPKVLHKPGKLTNYECMQIKKHVEFGAVLAMQMKLSKDSIRAILAHHESFDGSGYITGSKGKGIPLGGRILKICDVYDALSMDRSYRRAYSKKEVKEKMEKEKHTFDPQIYDIFWEVITGED
jgi:putative nucleotidyltransferase with HDIG domain